MRRGRLFWKFFLFFWVAQLVITIGVGMAIWLLRPKFRSDTQWPSSSMLRPPHMPPAELRFPETGPPRPHGMVPLPLVIPLLGGGIVGLLYAALLAGYFAVPIGHLKRAFDATARGQLDTRVGPVMGNRRDELADLGNDFDSMAERLQGLVEGQRRLLHDVSHELRSPLARLQAASDLLTQQPERGEEFAARIERDVKRMDRLVAELLTVARLDAGITGALDRAINLFELVDVIADDATFEAAQKQVKFRLIIQESLTLTGNHELLYRALENIVRNAVRHSPHRGLIVISGVGQGAHVSIEIRDQGDGIPETDLEKIFEPFARSTDADAFAGHGLGLAITKRIVMVHGGSICARNSSEGGLCVTLRFPLPQHASGAVAVRT